MTDTVDHGHRGLRRDPQAAELDAVVHISSALVRCRAEDAEQVVEAIHCLPGTEVFHSEGGWIVVVLEGPSTQALGARLAEISLFAGVVSATMVYEQVESLESLGEHP